MIWLFGFRSLEVIRMKYKIFWFLTFLPLVVTCFILAFLPESIPVHYNSAGIIDRWGSKYEHFIFPVLIIIFSLFWKWLITIFKKRQTGQADDMATVHADNNIRFVLNSAIITTLLFNLLHYYFVYASYVESKNNMMVSIIDFSKFSCFLMGLVIISIGNMLPRAKRSSFVGVRTPWSFMNDDIWALSNRWGGRIFFVTGILIILASCIVDGSICLWIGLLLDVLAAVGCYIASYFAYRKLKV